MSTVELVRAWKDEDYRLGLDVGDVPAHPAGDRHSELTLGDDDPWASTTVSVIENPFVPVA